MTGQTDVHISENYHTTPRSNKKEIIIVAENCFYATLAVLPTAPIIFGIKHFDIEVRAFLSSCPELNFTYKW